MPTRRITRSVAACLLAAFALALTVAPALAAETTPAPLPADPALALILEATQTAESCEAPFLIYVPTGPIFTDCVDECNDACGSIGQSAADQIWDRSGCYCICCP